MKLLKILSESLPDIVYHFTYLNNIINILETNKITLSSALGSTADLKPNRGKFNFLSTTRSKSSGYKRGNTKIVLDGQKLNYNYKSIPLDYWGYSKNPKDWTDKSAYIQALGSEQEDRIVSDKTTIPNFKKYILAIHVNISNYKRNKLNKIKDLANQNNIPLYLYSSQENWEKQINNIDINTIPQNSEEDDYHNMSSNTHYREYDLASAIAYNNPENYKKIIDYINDETEIKSFNEHLSKRIYEWFSINASYKDDAIAVIMSIIHNNRSTHKPEIDFLMTLLIKEMRKLKVKTIRDYLEEKRWIGKKSIKNLKKELISHLFSIIDNVTEDEINYRLQEWVEIDGTYYNKAYESPEIREFLKTYNDVIKRYVANKITDEPNDLHRIYSLDKDYINKHINLNNLNLNFNITDYNDFLDLKEKLKEILYRVTVYVSVEYWEKSEELMKEYYKQFRN